MKNKKRSVITVGRDGSEIKIYTLRTSAGFESYQCAWHDAGRRQTKTFGQLDAAKLFAQQKCVALANGLPEITSATLRDIEVFKSCETRVARLGLTVPAAIDEWLSARDTLGALSLSEAVQFFMRHRAGITPIRLGDLVPLFLELHRHPRCYACACGIVKHRAVADTTSCNLRKIRNSATSRHGRRSIHLAGFHCAFLM